MQNSRKANPESKAKGFTFSNPFRAVFSPFAHTKNSKVLIIKTFRPAVGYSFFYKEVALIHHTTKTSLQKIELIYYA